MLLEKKKIKINFPSEYHVDVPLLRSDSSGFSNRLSIFLQHYGNNVVYIFHDISKSLKFMVLGEYPISIMYGFATQEHRE